MDIFDFELTENEMKLMRTLDKGEGSHDPDAEGVEEMLLSAIDIYGQNIFLIDSKKLVAIIVGFFIEC